jgi:hypothetical protein
MKIDLKFINLFNKLSSAQKGVFTLKDLTVIICPSSKVDLYRQIKKMINEGLISQASRGVYIASEFSIESLVLSIKPEAIFSLEYALGFHNMIGTYTNKKIRPVITSSSKNLINEQFTIEFKKMKANLIFGFDVVNGIRVASKEKALLDTLYYYQSGTKFFFDIYSDIATSGLDKELIEQYLLKYKNPKFISFVRDYLND